MTIRSDLSKCSTGFLARLLASTLVTVESSDRAKITAILAKREGKK